MAGAAAQELQRRENALQVAARDLQAVGTVAQLIDKPLQLPYCHETRNACSCQPGRLADFAKREPRPAARCILLPDFEEQQ